MEVLVHFQFITSDGVDPVQQGVLSAVLVDVMLLPDGGFIMCQGPGGAVLDFHFVEVIREPRFVPSGMATGYEESAFGIVDMVGEPDLGTLHGPAMGLVRRPGQPPPQLANRAGPDAAGGLRRRPRARAPRLEEPHAGVLGPGGAGAPRL